MSTAKPGKRRPHVRQSPSSAAADAALPARGPTALLLAGLLGAALLSSGCSKLVTKLDQVMPDNRKEYQRAQSLPDLEVPPDLSTSAIRDRMAIPEGGEAARFSTFQERRVERERADVLERAQTSAIRVLENEHVLAVEGAIVQVWPRLQDFFTRAGYSLELDDVDLGIIETGWNEDDAQLSRSKFKVFAESGEAAGTTLLYVSREDQELVPRGEDLVWQRKPRDVEAERALVERLESRLGDGGATRRTAAAHDADRDDLTADESGPVADFADPDPDGPRHAEIVRVGEGKIYLTVAEDFAGAWKTTGRALEQAGVTVRDSDKGRGVYIVELAGGDEKGSGKMFSKLKFWGKDGSEEYQLSLTGVGEKTEVVLLDRSGRWATGPQAGELLTALSQAVNRSRR